MSIHSRTIVVGRFEWDAEIEARNIKLNGVTFAEGITIFEDQHAVFYTLVQDSFIVGRSNRGTLLTVGFTVPFANRTHIESASHASPRYIAIYRFHGGT